MDIKKKFPTIRPASSTNKYRTEITEEGFSSPLNSVSQFKLQNDSDGSESDHEEFVSAKGSFAAPKVRS